MDEANQSSNVWLQYNYPHEAIDEFGIPFEGQLPDAVPESSSLSSEFLMGPAGAVGVSTMVSDTYFCPSNSDNTRENPTISTTDVSLKASTGKAVRQRSRASRRTPTTLLNTDIHNFRSLVQQYTGCQDSPQKNQKGPVNLSFIGSSSDQQIGSFAAIPRLDGRYYDGNGEPQKGYQLYHHKNHPHY